MKLYHPFIWFDKKEGGERLKTNVELLDQIIEASGLKISYLADKCGLSRTSFYKKKNGLVEWTASEIAVLRSELHLTLTQAKEIFLI